MKAIASRLPVWSIPSNAAALFAWLALSCAPGAIDASAASIAYWQFEPADPAADSSGSGNALSLSGVTTDPDKAPTAPGTTSLVFDGNSFAQTLSTLNLSTYTNITIEWFMKTTQSSLGMVMEHSANMNTARGGFYSDINEDGAGYWAAVNSGQTGNAGKMTPFDIQGGWHHYAFTIDTALSSSNRLNIFLDGILVTNLVARHLFDASAHTALLDDVLYIGARSGAQFFYTGSLDELRISDQILTPDQFLSPVTHPNAVITIVQQPANATAMQNRAVMFTTEATIAEAPASALAYQWQKQGAGSSTWVDIGGARSATLTLPSVALGDANSSYRAKAFVPGGPSVFSAAAVLTVTPDTGAPEIVSVGSLEGTAVGVVFDEPLDPASAAGAGNYRLSGGVSVSEAVLQPDGRSVALTTGGINARTFTLTVNGVKDLAGNTASVSAEGQVLGMTGEDIGGPHEAGSSVAFGPGDINVLAGGYDIYGLFDTFHFTHQQETGDFDLSVRVDRFNSSAMWALAQLMVRETLAEGSRHMSLTVYPTQKRWQAYGRLVADTQSALFPGASNVPWPGGSDFPDVWLRIRRTGEAFTAYGGTNGLDWIQAGEPFTPDPPYPATVYVGLGTTSTGDNTGAPMAFVQYRAFGATRVSPPTILRQPAGGSRIVGGSYQFDVVFGGTDPFSFQWQKDGSDIAGAVGATLSLTNLQLSDAGAYRILVRNAAGEAVSEPAQLIVSSDTVPPQMASAYHTVDGKQVVVVFDENLDASSANTPGNYTISSAAVSAAALQADGRTVVLSVSGLTETGFGLSISNVKDLFGNALSGVTTTVGAGLRGHYEFEGNLNDSSPRVNHASPVEGPTFSAGKIGQALVLNGSGQRADAGDPGLGGAVAKSVSVWFNQAEDANKGVVSFGNNLGTTGTVGGGLFEILLHSGHVAGHFSGAGYDTINGAPLYTAGEWHHTVLTYDGATVRVYYDGQFGNELALALSTATDNLHLGSGSADDNFTAYAHFNGMIDDVGVWDRELSAPEIQAIYEGGLAGKNLNLNLTPVVAVRLTVAHSAEGITLSWPETAGDFVPESTGALPTSNWTPITAPPQTVGGKKSVVVQPSGVAQFYRLRK
ncbi:MAG: LamG-like jellyroll fold domain-containing protein [Verrucomicrobiia bacterium]